MSTIPLSRSKFDMCKETEAEKTQRKAKETRQGRGLRT